MISVLIAVCWPRSCTRCASPSACRRSSGSSRRSLVLLAGIPTGGYGLGRRW